MTKNELLVKIQTVLRIPSTNLTTGEKRCFCYLGSVVEEILSDISTVLSEPDLPCSINFPGRVTVMPKPTDKNLVVVEYSEGLICPEDAGRLVNAFLDAGFSKVIHVREMPDRGNLKFTVTEEK